LRLVLIVFLLMYTELRQIWRKALGYRIQVASICWINII